MPSLVRFLELKLMVDDGHVDSEVLPGELGGINLEILLCGRGLELRRKIFCLTGRFRRVWARGWVQQLRSCTVLSAVSAERRRAACAPVALSLLHDSVGLSPGHGVT